METLWAPWRMKYIQNVDKVDDNECIFCKKPSQPKEKDRGNLLLFRGEKCFVLMNLYPYNNGHLMIIPYVHTSDILSLDKETSSELWELLCKSREILTKAINPDAFNIGMNIGRVAGAGIDQHIHMHIVPRWNGDTNFMPVIGKTKVISQSLEDTYDTLYPYFQELC
ncbi:MAG: HIT domain-containing protein [Fibrobacter sp.]|nr:HIT domain-containing protein [Fibrobacter sp.]